MRRQHSSWTLLPDTRPWQLHAAITVGLSGLAVAYAPDLVMVGAAVGGIVTAVTYAGWWVGEQLIRWRR